jgi:hypothetical protein
MRWSTLAKGHIPRMLPGVLLGVGVVAKGARTDQANAGLHQRPELCSTEPTCCCQTLHDASFNKAAVLVMPEQV